MERTDKPHFETGSRAFTLVELLIVIAILALLLTLLIPTLENAKRQSLAVVCRSNEKQWGLFFTLFLQENRQKFTGLGYHKWMDVLEPYYEATPDIVFCPAATLTASQGADPAVAAWEEEGRKGSYGTNYWIRETAYPYLPATYPSNGWWKTFDVPQANSVPVLLDAARPSGLPLYDDLPPEYDGQTSSYEQMQCMRYFCVNRHAGTVNGLFMDMSVSPIPLRGLWQLRWHQHWNPNRTPPPAWPDWMPE
ncbi:MAG: prepilin-type N-terminal cleavage/methylation domain-containing protein [Sedimentisphaerales bacterium]|nr:prepilin-type N-terminal cleavage/methylation domain-containing protein [Sedimentisphaerales bacterium]